MEVYLKSKVFQFKQSSFQRYKQMGAQSSLQDNQIACPKVFKCWYEGEGEASPYKDRMEQNFFYEIDVRDLLQSNKDKDKERRANFLVSAFKNDLQSNSHLTKQNTAPYSQAISLGIDELNAETCRKQLFARRNPQKEGESIQTIEETVKNQMKQALKENQNIGNLSINSKILFEKNQSNTKIHTANRQKMYESPQITDSPLTSLDSDIPMLKQISNQPKTPLSESWQHFLQSVDKGNFLKSNQGRQNRHTTPRQKSNKLINYLHTNSIGNTEGSIPNGYGQIRYKNGDMLCGFFQNNLCEGKGKYIKKDGSLYEGEFVQGLACGTGIYVGSDGYRYEGDWKDNLPCGHGKAIYSDLQIYQGQFSNGKRHGNGTFIQNGSKYVGEFKNDQIDGTALFFSDNGETYNGEWKENTKEGFGEYRWPNGDRYVGNYRKGRREGFGVMYYQNGDTFSGNWRNGMKNGQGIYSTSTGTITGSWVRSKYVGDANFQ